MLVFFSLVFVIFLVGKALKSASAYIGLGIFILPPGGRLPAYIVAATTATENNQKAAPSSAEQFSRASDVANVAYKYV